MYDMPGFDYMLQWLPYVIGSSILVLIFVLLWGPIVKRKVQTTTFTGMTVQDIDKMRRDGVISEDEYKRIRHKAAERELELMREKSEADRDRLILAEVELNPDAARKLLKPEQLASKKPIAIQPNEPPAAQPAPRQPDISPLDWGDPLSGESLPQDAVVRASAIDNQAASPDAYASVTHPHPGKIRIPPPHLEPKKEEPPGELELLFQKGAITREDYERFKALMKK